MFTTILFFWGGGRGRYGGVLKGRSGTFAGRGSDADCRMRGGPRESETTNQLCSHDDASTCIYELVLSSTSMSILNDFDSMTLRN